MQKVYGIIRDNGDGSCSMVWFKDKSIVESLLGTDPEAFYANEGLVSEELTFPDDLDLEKCGFSFSDEDY